MLECLSDSGLKALVPRDKKYRVSVGDAPYIIVYPNGGKYFVWRYRFPPDRSGQFRDYQIGPYVKGVGKWSLKQARTRKTASTNSVRQERTHVS